MSVQKCFFVAFRNLLNFWSRAELNQIQTIQFDRVINALSNGIKRKNV
jgi:hypothetical protein